MTNFVFDDFQNLLRVLLSAPILYFAVIAFIRVSGKRSTSQMNNFDWIVTVAMGSLFGSGVILENVTILEVLLAIATLLMLQFVVTRAIVSSDRVANLVKANPTLVVYNGTFRHEAMVQERLSEREIYAAIRQTGLRNLQDVGAVVLETDAQLTVLPKGDQPLQPATNYADVRGWPGSGK